MDSIAAQISMYVATREGGVDRKSTETVTQQPQGVATREGGVDRKILAHFRKKINRQVATREGGVDRKIIADTQPGKVARRHPRGWRG